MSECVEDMVAYTLLDDTILRQIEASPLPELAPARALIARVRRRQLYVCVGEVLLSEDFEFHAKESSTPSSAGPSGTQRRKMVVDTGLIRAVIASLAGAALDTEDQASLDAFKRLPRSACLRMDVDRKMEGGARRRVLRRVFVRTRIVRTDTEPTQAHPCWGFRLQLPPLPRLRRWVCLRLRPRPRRSRRLRRKGPCLGRRGSSWRW